jgi:PAS domain S-box-containing protein
MDRSPDSFEPLAIDAERARLAAIVETSGDAILSLRPDGVIETWNEGAERLYGYSAEEAIGEHVLLRAIDSGERAQWLSRSLEGTLRDVEFPDVRKDGTRVWVSGTSSPIRDQDGRVISVSVILRDVTERKAIEAERARLAAIVESSGDAIISLRPDGTIETWNHGAERLYGYTAEEAVGRHAPTLLSRDAAEREALLTHAAAGVMRDVELMEVRKDGTTVEVSGTSSPILDKRGRVRSVAVILRDVSQRHAAERREQETLALLRAITENMAEGIVSLDSDGRLLYMNHAAEELLGWRLEELLGRSMHDAVHRLHDGPVLQNGGCPLTRAASSGEPLLVEDDTFLHRDGHTLAVAYNSSPLIFDHTRGSVVVFSDITERKAEEARRAAEQRMLTWVGRVRDALDEDRFVLYAQPIVDLTSGATAQHELLIRMLDGREPNKIIAPGEFLPAAERYGLICEIDAWVIRQAARLAGQGHPIEFNLSAESLAQPEQARTIARTFSEAGADPKHVVCEITETSLLQNQEFGRAFAKRLTRLGFQLALDDFGTGYGGFTYLTMLPVTHVKIDRSFVRDLPHNAPNQHLVRSIVGLAKGLDKKTVAEGVEDEATLELLRSIGVDYAQGYHLGRPAPLPEVFGA